MTEEPEDEKRHAAQLIHTLTRRLRLREYQKARLGDTADPSVDTEIEDLELNIAMLKPIVEPQVETEVQSVVKRYIADDYLFIYTQVVKFGKRVTNVEVRQDEDAKDRTARQHAVDERFTKQDQILRLLLKRSNVRLGIECLIVALAVAAIVLALWRPF